MMAGVGYYNHSVSDISLSLSQSDHIKRRLIPTMTTV
jgi:hypothetical protein